MIISIGAFDGFHRGHQKLFEVAREMAHQGGTSWGVVTFSPHPQKLFAPSSFMSLFSESERDVLSRYLAIPELRKLNFGRWLAESSPADFLDYLARSLPIEGIVVGEDFRFGRGRQGDRCFLSRECERRGWQFHFEPPLLEGDLRISSSTVRSFVTSGDVHRAKVFLGYPFWVQGIVVRGDQRGRRLGFPTANVSVPAGKVIPERGVYAAAVMARGKWWAGALNVGYNPTFEGCRAIRFEVHLLGFQGNLYDEQLCVFILERLRPEHRFDRFEALQEQLALDVETTRRVWKCHQEHDDWDSARFLEVFEER